mgnify:CR=1 FL=1
MPYFDAGETTLPNLIKLKSACAETVDNLNPKDYVLSDNFLRLYKRYSDSVAIDYTGPYSISQHSASGNIEVLPSFLILRASLAVPFLKGLKKYRDLFSDIEYQLKDIFKLDDLQTIADILRGTAKGRTLQAQESNEVANAARQILLGLNVSDSDAQTSVDRFMKFLTDYKSWGGGKNICRVQGDYYISAVTSALKLVQASNESVARVTGLMDRHDDLYCEARHIIGAQSMNSEETSEDIPNEVGNNLIIYGAPGTGKSHELESRVPEKYKEHIRRVVFHSEYSYFDFVGSYKPTPVYQHDDNHNEYVDASGKEIQLQGTPVIDYQFVPGPFTESLIDACNNPKEPYYLIIEEINRANAAAVFGDIFQLLDRNEQGRSKYGVAPSKELRDYLGQHLNSEGSSSPDELRIPSNLFLWATMNNADQGVMFMDSAFKRRWNFEYETISLPLNEKLGISQIAYNNGTWTLLQILSAINEKLRKMNPPIPEDRLIGQFFLPKESLNSEADIQKAFKKVLIYLWDDVLRNNNRNNFFDSSVDSLSYLFENYPTKDVLQIKDSLKLSSVTSDVQPDDDSSEADTDGIDGDAGQDE